MICHSAQLLISCGVVQRAFRVIVAFILSLPGRQEVPVDVESLPGARYRMAWETDVTGGLRTSSSSIELVRPARLPPASPRAAPARWRA